MRNRRLAVLVAAVAGLAGLSACGAHEQKAAAETQSGLGAVKRGVMTMRLTAAAGSGRDVGFEVRGPFDLSGKPGTLPVARLTFTRLLGARSTTATLVSTGTEAFVEADGRVTKLADQDVASLRLTKASSSGVAGLHLEEWMTGRAVRTRAGGVERISGTVDPVRVLNDVFAMAGQFGGGVGPITGKAADQLRRATTTAQLTAVLGAGDHLVRDLSIDLAFAAQSVPAQLQKLGSARFHIELAVDKPNQAIEPVSAP
jgi:hypothetical protein